MNHPCRLILTVFFLHLPISLHSEDRAVVTALSMAYVLQADQLAPSRKEVVAALASCNRDLIVLDYAYTTEPNGRWTTAEIGSIRKGKQGRKVVAYISIGEAEDYRPYWQHHWDSSKDGRPDKGSPSFLNAVNPDWEGNYKVSYWDKSWQGIILKYVDKISAQGFDGIYLDIVDAFEFFEYDAKTRQWQDGRKNPATRNTYRQDMVIWVQKIARHARRTNADFLIIPQNGPQLLAEPGYRETIDAIGLEDLFTNGNRKQKQKHIDFVIGFLANNQKIRMPVFLIEYGKKRTVREHSVKRAKLAGLNLLLTTRDLSTLGNCVGDD